MVDVYPSKQSRDPWYPRIFTIIFCLIILIMLVIVLWLHQAGFSLLRRSYPIELVHHLANEPNKMMSAHHATARRGKAPFVSLPTGATSAVPAQTLGLFLMPARFEQHFCLGDSVLITSGQQQNQGILRLKVAAGSGQSQIQLGIEISEAFLYSIANEDKLPIQLRRLSYQAGDWRVVRCLPLARQIPQQILTATVNQ